MKLIETHTTENGGVRHLVAHYRHDDTPVKVTVHRDPYNFQCYATVERWTTERGYVVIVTGNGDDVHARRFEPNEDLASLANDLIATYDSLLGGTS